jgi:hypothetical protein
VNQPDAIILKSVHKRLADAFEDGEIMGAPYTVGNDGDMRLGTKLTFPYIYILPFGRLFQIEHLPVIIVQVTIYSGSADMGDTDDGIFDVTVDLHIFGRDPVQKANVKGAIRRNIKTWELYDFDSSSTPVLEECAIIEDGDAYSWKESNHSINSEKLAIEASLADWTTLSCAFQAVELGG